MNKLLVIEDDEEMCFLLKKFLEKYEFEVHIAHNGKQGIEEFEKQRPDLVICDYLLGDMNGREVIEKIKTSEPNVPIVVITGEADTKTAITLMKNGASDFMLKPVLPDETIRVVKNALLKNQNPTDFLREEIESTDKPKISLNKHLIKKSNSDFIFGRSANAKEMMRQIELVAPTNYSVII